MRKKAIIAFTAIMAIYLILLIPGPEPAATKGSEKAPFAWNQDETWLEFEKRFLEFKRLGCESLAAQIGLSIDLNFRLLDSLSAIPIGPESSLLLRLEDGMFSSAVMIAACPQYLSSFQALAVRLRNEVKSQSCHWDMRQGPAQVAAYRLMYGTRAALEEIMLQAGSDSLSPLLYCRNEPSMTASAKILGVGIHSGDILISRGGAPTSALIARGNNFQGNFSHAALVYVDPESNLAKIIESHIERGVTISSPEDYLRDTKLRVMVLRLRHDLQQLVTDPTLPHRAAQSALNEAESRHIPYDFRMDAGEAMEKYCSEVVSEPYGTAGVRLWTKATHISSPGAVAWLSAFGVRNFETEAPSDLEYDPQLAVVAEWRDIETLWKDHVDNAVIDAMLEAADRGEKLTYNIYLLPMARIAKVYSWVLNRLGMVGPIPEGMSAEAALKNKGFSKRHAAIKARMLILARQFQEVAGYRPPYWELLRLARQAKQEIDG
ncbi:MAG: hypothetical protein A2W25_10170 [candidate division Zixibacteria bacterium RBG_16_53_22]|nr:MAG: hypothetical protein A2W25_10170 [candidate division Zixibacteria bacterium RBG_16_53_22]